jgi:hypothetical protein
MATRSLELMEAATTEAMRVKIRQGACLVKRGEISYLKTCVRGLKGRLPNTAPMSPEAHVSRMLHQSHL